MMAVAEQRNSIKKKNLLYLRFWASFRVLLFDPVMPAAALGLASGWRAAAKQASGEKLAMPAMKLEDDATSFRGRRSPDGGRRRQRWLAARFCRGRSLSDRFFSLCLRWLREFNLKAARFFGFVFLQLGSGPLLGLALY